MQLRERLVDPGLSMLQKGKPQGGKLRREEDAVLAARLRGVSGQMAADLRVGEAPAQQVGLTLHGVLRTAAVAVGDLVVVGHARAHLRVFLVELPGCAVEHHEDRRRAEGPRAAEVDAAGRARHARAGRAVELAHGGDVVVAQKAHHQVAFAEIVAFLRLGKATAGLQTLKQKLLQPQQLRDLPEGIELAHQHAKRVRVPPERLLRARLAPA